MRHCFIFVRFITIALLVLDCGSAAFAQGEKTDLGGDKQTSQSGLTGAGAGGSSTTAATPGGADSLRNPILGGERYPLYRLRPSDVVDVSFTVAPEFNQTLTVQPDGYVMLKDAGMVEAVEIAGGLTQQAKHSQVVLFRRVNNDLVETRLLNLKKMLKDKTLKEDAHLRPGDLVFVPQNSISKIARYLTKPSLSAYVSPTQF